MGQKTRAGPNPQKMDKIRRTTPPGYGFEGFRSKGEGRVCPLTVNVMLSLVIDCRNRRKHWLAVWICWVCMLLTLVVTSLKFSM